MKQLDLTPEERAHYEEYRSLTTDEAGNETLVGLTREESEWLVQAMRAD